MNNWHESKQATKPRQNHSHYGGAGGAVSDARERLRLDKLFSRYGDAFPLGRKGECFACKRRTATAREHNGRLWWRCFHPECPTKTFAPRCSFDEIAYLGFKLGCSSTNGGPGRYSDAAKEFLRAAGIWRDNDTTRDEQEHDSPPSPPSPNPAPAPIATTTVDILDSETSPEDDESAIEVTDTAEPSLFIDKGRKILEELHRRLHLSEQDFRVLFERRGFTSVTARALRYRSNPRSNLQLLQQMVATYGWTAMIASGLALLADARRRLPNRLNMQFCGKGQAGKIPKAERKNPNIKVRWDWVEPILIPYFSEDGDLMGLRPHKGGAPAGTAASDQSLYIPRAFEPPFNGPEKFTTVIITEGEFKAAALWQTVGVGARQFVDENQRPMFTEDEYGVCAIPGISYARHAETRAMLDTWLQAVGCRQVIVGFDYEVKWDPKLPSYESDPAHRYDSLIYAFYLASDISRKLRIHGRVCLLPNEWLNASGKADWDGALASIAHQQTSVDAA